MVRVIIGCGTELRGDDEAGLLAARYLRLLGVDALEHSRDGLALMERWVGADEVVLIDAVACALSAGSIVVWDGRAAPVAADGWRGSTHAFGVAEAVEMARALNLLPERLTIYGIAGRYFEVGTRATAAVAASAERLAHQLAAGLAGVA